MSVDSLARTSLTSMVCSGCGFIAPPLAARPFRCPNAGNDDIDHLLRRRLEPHGALSELHAAFVDSEPDPFIRYRRLMHVWQTATAAGISDSEYVDKVDWLERRITAIDGVGFHVTPLIHHHDLWIKDETGNVAGSHKARHMMGLMLWLELMKRFDPALEQSRLAIASCGNAALAAAVVARAGRRPLDVFVPVDASPRILRRLEELGARVMRCERRPGELGDPSVLRFRQAVAAGALPFTCQGNENGLVVEGGQTLGWEMVSQLLATGDVIDRLFVQVGGGALASACIAAFEDAHALGLIERLPRIHAVQTRAVFPLVRAWERMQARHVEIEDAVRCRSEFMTPWPTAPHSVATGILDDETYDWAAVIRGMVLSNGFPIVVTEEQLVEANEIANETVDVDPTGSSGFAGYLALERSGTIGRDESIAVLFTGKGSGL